MGFILKPFMLLALLGFIASLIAHLFGYAGVEKPFGINPWPLHIGIFVVWLPAVIVAQRLSKEFPQKDLWKATLRGCPPWMRISLYVLFAYAFLSFFVFVVLGAPSGKESSAVRGFSGHWLIFYYAAFAILYSAIQVSEKDTIRRCKNGHPLKESDKYCSQCGLNVGSLIE
jgi:hypothetical protein